MRFIDHVQSLVSVIEENGNPFLDESDTLVTLVSKTVLPSEVAKSLYEVEGFGKQQFEAFFQERLVYTSVIFAKSVTKNNILFGKSLKGKKRLTNQNKTMQGMMLDFFSKFYSYCVDKLVIHMKFEFQMVARKDIVWDVYRENSLKASIRQRRGTGKRQRVQENVTIKQKWTEFLRVDTNKVELFVYLAKELFLCDWGAKTLVTTFKENVLSNNQIEYKSQTQRGWYQNYSSSCRPHEQALQC